MGFPAKLSEKNAAATSFVFVPDSVGLVVGSVGEYLSILCMHSLLSVCACCTCLFALALCPCSDLIAQNGVSFFYKKVIKELNKDSARFIFLKIWYSAE